MSAGCVVAVVVVVVVVAALGRACMASGRPAGEGVPHPDRINAASSVTVSRIVLIGALFLLGDPRAGPVTPC